MQVALRVIAMRRWRNGYLDQLIAKALSGEPLTREDTACTEKEWALCEF